MAGCLYRSLQHNGGTEQMMFLRALVNLLDPVAQLNTAYDRDIINVFINK